MVQNDLLQNTQILSKIIYCRGFKIWKQNEAEKNISNLYDIMNSTFELIHWTL